MGNRDKDTKRAMANTRWNVAGLALLCLALLGAHQAARAETVTVFAAASLKPALDEIADRYETDSGHQIHRSYGGSSALARQIQHGAPAQLFLSANTAWMDALEADGLLAPDTRRDLLTNRLALIAPANSPLTLAPEEGAPMAKALGDDRLAIALVQAVPAGIYGRQALTYLGLWDQVQLHLAQTDNVTAALRLVSLGEAPLGIVYATDARARSEQVDDCWAFSPKARQPSADPSIPVALLHEGGHVPICAAPFLDFPAITPQAAGTSLPRKGLP